MSNEKQSFLLSPADVKRAGSTWATEFIGGTQTFMTLAYILVVQPAIMALAGLPQDIIFSATIVFSILPTLAMGVYAKFPFVMSTAMGVNIIYANLVSSGTVTWQEGFGLVFWAGVIFLLTSIRFKKFSIREVIINNIPVSIKFGMGALVGLFLASLGFGNAGISRVVDNQVSAGDLRDPAVVIALVGLVVTCFLFFGFTFLKKGDKKENAASWKLPGAILVGIVLLTAALAAVGKVTWPGQLLSMPADPFALFPQIASSPDFWGAILKVRNWSYILVFFLGALFSTIGTSIGCAAKAGLMDPKTGEVPGIHRLFVVDSFFSCVGAMFGLTDITTFVESAAGVEAGGRTGWTAVFTACWFALTLFMAPIFLMIPGAATGVALIVVGLSMLLCLAEINFGKPEEVVPILFMMVATAFTGDFTIALCMGLIIHPVWMLLSWLVYLMGCKRGGSGFVYSEEVSRSLRPTLASAIIALVGAANLFLSVS